MKRQFSLGLMAGFGVLAVASAMGCEAQVNDDYTGEPLLSLQGDVVVRDGADENAVPGIAFTKADDRDNTMVIVDGELHGEFPAKFRFDVTQPPPEEALHEPFAGYGLETKYSLGVLVLAPSNRDRPITESLHTPAWESQCTEDGSQCTHFKEECADENGERCRERVLTCTQRPCELVEQWGDTAMEYPVSGTTGEYCESDTCYMMESGCDEQKRCRTDVYRCDFAQYGAWEGGAPVGSMNTCVVESTSGDTSFLALEDLQVASNFWVVYVTGDNPNSAWGPLKRGYNLIAVPTSYEEWVAAERCALDEVAAAVAEYNEEHGTDYDPLGFELDYLYSRVASLTCGAVRVIERPLDEVFTIEMGNIEPNF